MCGRFTLFDGLEILKKHFPIDQEASEITPNYNMINARVETVETKPAFRNAFKKRRCLTDLAIHPVSKRVNNVENNDPANIEPVGR